MTITTIRHAVMGKHMYQLVEVKIGKKVTYIYQHYVTRFGGNLGCIHEATYTDRKQGLYHWQDTFIKSLEELDALVPVLAA